MGRVGADQPLLPGRRQRADIARRIGGGQPGGAQAGDHDLREILAHAAALRERLARAGCRPASRSDRTRTRAWMRRASAIAASSAPRSGSRSGAHQSAIAAVERDARRGEQIRRRARRPTGRGWRAPVARPRPASDRSASRHRHQPVDRDARARSRSSAARTGSSTTSRVTLASPASARAGCGAPGRLDASAHSPRAAAPASRSASAAGCSART